MRDIVGEALKLAALLERAAASIRDLCALLESGVPLPSCDEKTWTAKDLGLRSRKVLLRKGIDTFGTLSRYSEDEILQLRNCGDTSLMEMREALANRGLAFRRETLSGSND